MKFSNGNKKSLGNSKNSPKIFIASDHGGFKLKKKLFVYLFNLGYTVEDFGPHQLNAKDDYPDYAFPLAQGVSKSKNLGILICRNGQGMCIAANKVKGVRAVTGFSSKMIKSTRKDDNANVLCIPADYLSERAAKEIVKTFVKTKFSKATRHARRLNKIRKFKK